MVSKIGSISIAFMSAAMILMLMNIVSASFIFLYFEHQ